MKAEYQKRERKAIRTSNATDRERIEKAVGTLRGFGTGEPKTLIRRSPRRPVQILVQWRHAEQARCGGCRVL
ncbi:hypothetical protein, partial [Streptomyces malaysiensis]